MTCSPSITPIHSLAFTIVLTALGFFFRIMATVIYQRTPLSEQAWFGAYKLFPPKEENFNLFFFSSFLHSTENVTSFRPHWK